MRILGHRILLAPQLWACDCVPVLTFPVLLPHQAGCCWKQQDVLSYSGAARYFLAASSSGSAILRQYLQLVFAKLARACHTRPFRTNPPTASAAGFEAHHILPNAVE